LQIADPLEDSRFGPPASDIVPSWRGTNMILFGVAAAQTSSGTTSLQ
jgi:hypothetical protein